MKRDPRVVALGKAQMALSVAHDDLRTALRGLSINPDPITDIVLQAHCAAGAKIEKAMDRIDFRRNL